MGVAQVTEMAEHTDSVSVTMTVLDSLVDIFQYSMIFFIPHIFVIQWVLFVMQVDGTIIMENGLLKATIDQTGRLMSLLLVQTNR